MQRIVLDTNVIISALLFGGKPSKIMLQVLMGRFEVVTSPPIIEETSHVLADKFGIEQSTLKLLQEFLSSTEVVYFKPFLHILDDEPDNRILETAIRGRAKYIVTGDKQLLALKKYKNIQILSTAEFSQKFGIL